MQNPAPHAIADGPEGISYDNVVWHLPLDEMQGLVVRDSQFCKHWLAHPDYDDYLRLLNVEEQFKKINVSPLVELIKTYSTDAKAEAWCLRNRWPNGICCPKCGSMNVQKGCKHPTMPFCCREKACGRPRFSTKTGTVLEGSKLGYQNWIIAMFLVTTNLKCVASMKIHRDLGITQKSAWFLAHRLRGCAVRARCIVQRPGGGGRNLRGRKAQEYAQVQAREAERSRACGQDGGGGSQGSRDQSGCCQGCDFN